MKDRQEYEEARMKHLLEQRKKEDKKDESREKPKPKEPDMPTPNRPGALGWRTHARTKTITKTQASELLADLLAAYSDAGFQKKVHADAKAVMFEYQPFLRRLRRTAFEIQQPILAKWGFDESEEGLQEMMVCLSDHTTRDKDLRKLADETTQMLYGGEDGMWGMAD